MGRFILFLPEIVEGQHGEEDRRSDGDVGIGDILRGNERVEEDGAPAGDHEEFVKVGLFLPFFDHRVEGKAGPRQERHRQEHEIVEEIIVFRMF